jgi:hypothetical protein
MSNHYTQARMAAADAELGAIADRRNAIESLCLSLRSACDSRPHGALIQRDTLMPLLDSIEDWLWSDEANDATLQQVQSMLHTPCCI